VSRIWEDAGSILETAYAESDNPQSDFCILIDDRNGLRIVDGTGWQVESLRTEYRAQTAFLVKRTAQSVTVQAQNASERCELRRNAGRVVLTGFTGGLVANHLIRREPLAITAGGGEGYRDFRNIPINP
jgi:hypothetical protein